MPTPQTSSAPLRSEFASDPDMAEIVEMFVQEMPERIGKLSETWEQQKLDELRRVAHQLKGASGGYGFPSVGNAAAKLEKSLVDMGNGSSETTLDKLKNDLESLIALCKRVSI